MQATALQSRIQAIDIIRGFAVFGILLVNIPDMVGNGLHYRFDLSGSDAIIRLLYDLFIQTKFYTIFSFLFGLSFFLFMKRAEERGNKASSLFRRRLWILLGIGLIHLILLWFGDILHIYAAIGFLLFLFYKRKPRTLAVWGIVLIGLYTLITAASNMLMIYDPELANGSLFKAVPNLGERWEYFLTQGIGNLILISFEVLGLFLIGLYAGKKQWFEHRERYNSKSVKRTQWITLVLSLILFIPILWHFVTKEQYDSNQVIFFIYLSGKSMAIFYICTLLRLIARLGERSFSSLAAVGRMALTNYLMHTVLVFILYRWLWPGIGEAYWIGTATAALIIVLQLAASKLWLRYYYMGPIEWLWRAGTYGKFAPLRRKQEARSFYSSM
ncbi:DUF418 domain-containing protein [Paenibacillus sp. 1001270B_150601_E10]|uniref:DUF418 domain-containing protein n=1 Tax=Paenibacillus sp. 1001270B_150601_E10 TaxID=2787079 RepID=UPI00189FC5DC|nr:DUF418 domain-containing protein [Paenibacillus sp. 1001270B_150601_E10]